MPPRDLWARTAAAIDAEAGSSRRRLRIAGPRHPALGAGPRRGLRGHRRRRELGAAQRHHRGPRPDRPRGDRAGHGARPGRDHHPEPQRRPGARDRRRRRGLSRSPPTPATSRHRRSPPPRSPGSPTATTSTRSCRRAATGSWWCSATRPGPTACSWCRSGPRAWTRRHRPRIRPTSRSRPRPTSPTESPEDPSPTPAPTEDSSDEPTASDEPAETPSPEPTDEPTPDPTPEVEVTPTTDGAIEIASDVVVVGSVAAYNDDGSRFAFTARPADGSAGPDVYVWNPSDARARAVTDDHASGLRGLAGQRPAGQPRRRRRAVDGGDRREVGRGPRGARGGLAADRVPRRRDRGVVGRQHRRSTATA